MIVSIGIDIIEVGRVRKGVGRTPRFARRVVTRQERAYCDSCGVTSAKHYASRFAGKESARKALGTGWRGGVRWQDVEVTRQEGGIPGLVFRGEALETLRRSGATHAHLSLSHTSEHAIAQVILERIT